MGSKTQTVQQNQSYSPNALIGAYGGQALGSAFAAGQQPYSNMPVQPVAGFSADQLAAFNATNNLQGQAQPYFNEAANLIYGNAGPSQQNINNYYNAAVAGVMPQLQNVFGQQQSQNTASLVNAAGGVGADRIAVGQGNLANQQGLAAGQTLSGLYGNAVNQAMQGAQLGQSAGFGLANVGAAGQNTALQAIQAQLGTGGLQQQLAQAQLNAPYQWSVGQFQYPFQVGQYEAGITGGLAPAFGGTTQGQTTYPGPSLLSQLLGLGIAGGSFAGGLGSMGYKPFGSARGGAVDDNPFFAEEYQTGGAPFGDNPFASALVPDIPLHPGGGQGTGHIALANPPQQQNPFGQAGGIGSIVKGLTSLSKPSGASLDTGQDLTGGLEPIHARGGSVFAPHYDGGGDVDNYQDGGGTDPLTQQALLDYVARTPRLSDATGYVGSVDQFPGEGTPAGAFASQYDANMFNPKPAGVAQEFPSAPEELPPEITHPGGFGVDTAEGLPQSLSAYSPVDRGPPPSPDHKVGFGEALAGLSRSPWMAGVAAGLGIMSGTSPFALTNVGQGGLQGVKALEQQRQDVMHEEALRRQAAQQESVAAHQRAMEQMARQQYGRQVGLMQLESLKPFKIGMDESGRDIYGTRDPQTGKVVPIDVTGQPLTSKSPGTAQPEPKMQNASDDDGILPTNARLTSQGPYDYRKDAPYIEKGMDVPDPAPTAGKSQRSVQTDAEYYLQTGKLPPVSRGRSPVAIQQNEYRNAVQNYAGALAQSRGLTPEQTADMWRTAPGMLRFILGADGRSTVALGTAVRHLDTLNQLSQAWASGDVQTLNRLRAVVSREFGNEAATNLDAAGRIIGSEIIKAIGVAGAGTEDERRAAAAAFSTAASPQQMLGAIQTTQKLLGGQLEGRQRQASNAGVSTERFKSLIGDRPFEILTGIDRGAGGAQQSPQNKAALDWANAHPSDPRAVEIKRRLGVQ